MDNTKDPLAETGNPGQAYRDELANKGNIFSDTPDESEARDRAKIEKAQSGQSQKMDGSNSDEFDDGDLAEEIRRETLEKK